VTRTRRTALLLLAGALPALAGCGFSPLYGRGEDGAVTAELAKIRVLPIANRSGQILRNHLLDGLTPMGEPQKPEYTLQVALAEPNVQDLGISRSESVVRYGFSAVASFRLINSAGASVLQGASSGSSTFLVTNSEFATVSARSSARDRVMEEIAGDIKTQIGAFLRAGAAAARARR
jgi:LPS-assembly lipoprotein